MQKKYFYVFTFIAFSFASSVLAQQKGNLDESTMKTIKDSYKNSTADKAARNALGGAELKQLILNQENQNDYDKSFSIDLKTKGITNQKSSGRCWLFSGLNTLRSKVIAKYNPDSFEFSQNFISFHDLLEKSNMFLEQIIATAKKPMEDKAVDYLFRNVINDGGTYTGVADLISKYGIVPHEAMNETKSSNNTGAMDNILILKLREYGLQLRESIEKGTKIAEVEKQKVNMLCTIYRLLVINVGEPPTQFTYTMRDSKGKIISTDTYTPQSFRDKFIQKDAIQDYVMLMNDPTRPYYKTYEVENDRQLWDGHNWKYVNLPTEEIKEMAITSLKDSTMMYFGCDVLKCLDASRGLLDVNNYDYSILGLTFNMDKKHRIQCFASGSSHAMCLTAVDLDKNGKSKKWKVENSWGKSRGDDGYLIMTDRWFDEYMFRLVIKKKYATSKVLEILKQKPVILPPWDPMSMKED